MTDREQIYKAWQAVGADLAGLKWDDFVAALAQPEQGPVGYWEGEFSDDGGATLYEVPQQSIFGRKYRNEPLYASPPQRTWVGLTDEEELMIGVATGMTGVAIRMIEAKLKEKNNG